MASSEEQQQPSIELMETDASSSSNPPPWEGLFNLQWIKEEPADDDEAETGPAALMPPSSVPGSLIPPAPGPPPPSHHRVKLQTTRRRSARIAAQAATANTDDASPPPPPQPEGLYNLQWIKEEPADDDEAETGQAALMPPSSVPGSLIPPAPGPPPPSHHRVKLQATRRRSARIAAQAATANNADEDAPPPPPPPPEPKQPAVARRKKKPPPPPQEPEQPVIEQRAYQTPQFFKKGNYLPPETELSNFIENRVTRIIPGMANLLVREIFSNILVQEMEPKVHTFLEEFLPREIPYTKRTLVAFQEVPGEGVFLFFYLCVLEYGASCGQPYRNTVYISMLDSVRIFEPSNERTRLYQAIILSYMQYRIKGGTEKFFLWACPPTGSDEYVFNGRPQTQKTPTDKILIMWYLNMMRLAQEMGLLESYTTLYDWSPKTTREFFEVFPFYQGDHWEMRINEVVEAMEDLALNEDGTLVVPLSLYNKTHRTAFGNPPRKQSIVAVDRHDFVAGRILEEMKRHKQNFFVMKSNSGVLLPVKDKVLMPSSFGESRDRILNFQKELNLFFKNIKNAIRSTAWVLERLQMSFYGIFCDDCSSTFTRGEQCDVCSLKRCLTCVEKNLPHNHSSWSQMILWRENRPQPLTNDDSKNDTSSQDDKLISWKDFINGILEAEVLDPKMLIVLAHMKICENSTKCPLCRTMVRLYRENPMLPRRRSSTQKKSSASATPPPPPPPQGDDEQAAGIPIPPSQNPLPGGNGSTPEEPRASTSKDARK